MHIPYAGELASLLTSLMFSIGPTFFTLGTQKVGSIVVNRTRLLLTVALLLIVHWIAIGTPLPLDAEPRRWFWLGLSGVIGLALGDTALFQAFLLLGARLTMLIFSFSPVIAALFAWLFLGETLTPLQIVAIFVTVLGIAWVVAERNRGNGKLPDEERKRFGLGIFFAFLGMLGQALGLVTAKLGLVGGDFPALSGQIMRMLTAMVLIWLVTILQGQVGFTFMRIKENPLSLRDISLGVLAGPFIGVYFSLVGVQLTDVGIASTLQALPPIFMLPIAYFIFKERFSWQVVVGTIVALSGVAILFLV
ncbi:MAG: DMT family transporter [Anaerolineales bacterium]|nr:DMT family transporter [Anaerolineales bacterium]